QSRRAHVSCRASARVHGARLGRAAPVRRRRRGPAGRGADGGTRRLPEPLRARRAPGRPARRARAAGGVAPPVRAPRPRARTPRARRDRSRRRVLRARPSHARRREPRRPGADGLREGPWRRPLGRARAVALRRVDLPRSLSLARRTARYIPTTATPDRDYCEVLGGGPDPGETVIELAFRQLAGELHPGVAAGADLAGTVEIDLVEAAHGVTREVPFEAAVTCAHCGGDGAEPGTEITTCPTCDGTGRLQQVTRSVFGEFVRAQTCPTCAGT